MKKVRLLVCFSLIICLASVSAQTLSVNDAVSPANLITNLVTSNCDTVTSTGVAIDGAGQSINSYGSFTASDNPNFDLTEGIVLTTGTAVNAGTAGALNNIGSITNWSGSTFYENALGLTPGTTFNATEVEFTLKALKNNVVIDYVFASEEYILKSLCSRNEGVVILIKEASAPDNMYTNIALVPGTSDPVTVANIHAERPGECLAVNENYVGGARGFTTPFPNYKQHTTTLQAQTNSVMGMDYTIKIIIADEEDGNYDSAVFVGTIDNEQETLISATYASNGAPVTISSDTINECGQGVVLQLDAIYPPSYTYEWLNGAAVISGENTSSLSVAASGDYTARVYESSICFSEQTISVNLSTNQLGNDLEDLNTCVSSGSSGVFVLNNQDNAALTGRSSVNVDYYYNSIIIPEAQEGAYTGNDGDIIEAVVTEPGGCEYTSTFTLNVEVDGSFFTPGGYNLPICDDTINNDGFIAVYPSDLIALLPPLTIGTYTFYDDPSLSPSNEVTGGVGAFDNDLFYVVYEGENGCSSSSEIRIQVSQPPNLTGGITFIEECDDGTNPANGVARDGFANFDLTPKRAEIQAELDASLGSSNDSSAATITFYPSVQLANEGIPGTEINAANEVSYDNDVAYTLEQIQIVGIRIQDTANGNECYVLQSLELRPRYLLTNSTINDFLMCDPEGDGFEDFDLAAKKIQIVAGNNYAVSFFKTFPDARDNANELTNAIYTNETPDLQRLWLRIEDIATGCVDYDEEIAYIDLIVNSQPSISTPTSPLDQLCASGSSGLVNGLRDYFEVEIESEITTDPSIAVNYYFTQPDPNDEGATPRVTNLATSVTLSSLETYWAMGENSVSGCFSEPVSFQLQVNPTPIIDNNTPNAISYCYDATDVDPKISIDAEKDNIVLPSNQTGVLFRYFATQDLAIEGNDADRLDELDYFTDSDTSIWYRIEYTSTGCFIVIEQPIIVYAKPVIENLDDFTLCVAPNVPNADFLLSSRDALILGSQTGMEVRYFESLNDANLLVGEINKNSPFPASDGKDIFVRVENIGNPSCYNENNIQSFKLKISEYVDPGTASLNFPECGVGGFAEFNLQTFIDQITGNGSTNFESIKFYQDPSDARYQDPVPDNVQIEPAVFDSEINKDNDPSTLFFTNTTPSSQQIVVRIQSEGGCTSFQIIDLLVNELPVARAIENQPVCDTAGDGSELYDLTAIENLSDLDFQDMLRPFTNINEVEVNYFSTELGRDAYAVDNTSTLDKIESPEKENFLVNTYGLTPIYITINDASNDTCVFSTEFNLELQALPEITPKTVAVCEDALVSNEFVIDVDILNAEFEFYTGGDIDVRLDYFSDPLGASPISGQFIKTTGVTAIYLQAVNTRTNCESNAIIEIPLVANPLPTITTPTTLQAVTCDEDGVNDGVTVFALSALNSIVLNGQSPANFQVSYFDSGNVEMTDLSEVINGNTYTAVVTNTTTNTMCQNTTDFTFTVNQLPEIQVLNTLEFCDDDEITTNTTVIDLTEVIADFAYVTSVQAMAISAGGVRFYTDALRANEITTPETYSKIGDSNEVIYLDLLSINGCRYQTEFNIQVNPMPVIDFNAARPFVFCDMGANQYTLDLETDIATAVLDDLSLYTVTFHSDITATPANEISSPYVTGNTTIYIKVVSGVDCENIEPITIEIAPMPVVNPVAPSFTTVCDEDGDNDGRIIYDFNTLNTEVLGTQSATDYNVSYHETNQEAIDNIAFNLVEIISGTYYVKVQNIATACYAVEPITMTINTLPEIDGEEIFFCENNPVRIYDKNTGDPNDSYLWEFTSSRAPETTSDISLSFADVGSSATLTVTNSLTGCSNNEVFVIDESPTPDIKPIVTKYFDTDEVVIEHSEEGNYLYALTKTADIPDVSQAQESPVFTDLLPGKYYAHIIDLNGCGEVPPEEVNFVDYFPYFTPNGSGPQETETWHIQAIEEIPGTVVYIYDRFGVLMHTVTNGSPGWDGTYNGKPVPTDDYWILIELEDGETIKDNITLKR